MQDFMISRVRVKLLELFFQNIGELYYVREISRSVKEEINAVRRELDRMMIAGILKSEQRANRLYYYVNVGYTYYSELRGMVAKSTHLGKKLRKLKRKLGTVDFIMFSGNFVEGKKERHDDVDVLIVGDVVLPELQVLMKEEEERRGKEINYTVFSLEEFDFRKTRRDPFIMEILYGSRVMVVGSEAEFTKRSLPGLN
jgi:hypothetical protein